MTTTTYQTTGSAASVGTRIALTLVGAAGLIVGAFLEWTNSLEGTRLKLEALWRTPFQETSTFVSTVGFAAIVLGLAAVVGLMFSSGWLTRLAGALGIVVFVLFAIEVYRSSADETIGIGAWVALAGSLVAVIAGFFGPPRQVLATASAPPTVVVEKDEPSTVVVERD